MKHGIRSHSPEDDPLEPARIRQHPVAGGPERARRSLRIVSPLLHFHPDLQRARDCLSDLPLDRGDPRDLFVYAAGDFLSAGHEQCGVKTCGRADLSKGKCSGVEARSWKSSGPIHVQPDNTLSPVFARV